MKKLSIKNVLMYGISAVLVVFYLGVLYLGINPNVPPEYEMYYITHELAQWPGYDNLSYDLGTKIDCSNKYDDDGKLIIDSGSFNRRGKGWQWPTSNGTWSIEKTSAYVYFIPTESKNNAKFTIEIEEYLGDEKTSLYVGEECIGSFDSEGKYRFTIPEVTKDEKLVIRFESGDVLFKINEMVVS